MNSKLIMFVDVDNKPVIVFNHEIYKVTDTTVFTAAKKWTVTPETAAKVRYQLGDKTALVKETANSEKQALQNEIDRLQADLDEAKKDLEVFRKRCEVWQKTYTKTVVQLNDARRLMENDRNSFDTLLECVGELYAQHLEDLPWLVEAFEDYPAFMQGYQKSSNDLLDF